MNESRLKTIISESVRKALKEAEDLSNLRQTRFDGLVDKIEYYLYLVDEKGATLSTEQQEDLKNACDTIEVFGETGANWAELGRELLSNLNESRLNKIIEESVKNALSKGNLKRIVNLLKENYEDEGINFRTNDDGGKTAYYRPDKFNKVMDTHVLSTDAEGQKSLKAIVKYLPKTGVKTINLFNNLQPKYTKLFKHGTDENGEPVAQDKSMQTLYSKIDMYLADIVKRNLPDVDYILIPSSSSELNTKIAKELDRRLGGNTSYSFFRPDMFVKNIQTIEIDNEWLNKKADNIDKLSPDEYNQLLKRISKWKSIDEPIRGFRREIEQLEKEIEAIKNAKAEKRGRPSKEITDRQKDIEAKRQAIYVLRHSGSSRGKDNTVNGSGKVKEWQVKALEDKVRKAIKGFMQLNPEKMSLVRKLSGKKIVIFDDNISSGATMDDCCRALIKVGVKPKDILVLTLGIMDPTVYQRSDRTNSRIEP